MSNPTAISDPLAYNPISLIGTLPNPKAFGAPGGAGYTPGETTAYTSAGSPGSGATFTVVVGTDPGNYGQILSVGTLFGGGSGYQLGQPIYFAGPTGAGAVAYVSGVTGTNSGGTYVGAITQISFPPNGIANQILGMITGSGYASYYVSNPVGASYPVATIPNNGAVGAFNDQVTGYYNQSTMYQNQISNIISCLNQISAASADAKGPGGTQIVQGGGTLPTGITSWSTYSIATSVTGTTYNNYFTIAVSGTLTVYEYLKQYASITLNTSQSGTQAQSANIQSINSGLSPIQSNLGTANSFLQSAVSTLQSQISQFQQIVSQFYSAVQGAAGNIR